MNIYLDIDGVLLANERHAANHVHEFLDYVTCTYSVFWLTTHCRGDASTAVELLAHVLPARTMRLLGPIKPTNWHVAKTEGIDFSAPFLWFDDDLYAEEKRELVRHNVLENWIEVDLAKNENQLRVLLDSFPLPIDHIRKQ